MNNEHAIKAKNLSNLYLATVLDLNLFSHLRSEATINYPNCIFTVSKNIADFIAPVSENLEDFDPKFLSVLDVETSVELREQGIIGMLLGCRLTCNPDLPDNVVVAIGHDADFNHYNTRMRVLKFK